MKGKTEHFINCVLLVFQIPANLQAGNNFQDNYDFWGANKVHYRRCESGEYIYMQERHNSVYNVVNYNLKVNVEHMSTYNVTRIIRGDDKRFYRLTNKKKPVKDCG